MDVEGKSRVQNCCPTLYSCDTSSSKVTFRRFFPAFFNPQSISIYDGKGITKINASYTFRDSHQFEAKMAEYENGHVKNADKIFHFHDPSGVVIEYVDLNGLKNLYIPDAYHATELKILRGRSSIYLYKIAAEKFQRPRDYFVSGIRDDIHINLRNERVSLNSLANSARDMHGYKIGFLKQLIYRYIEDDDVIVKIAADFDIHLEGLNKLSI